ncbi:hypothetical protein EK0264_03335 [Epidermidibacterium keratini]|uniref:DUF2613 family protein n=1 Tax=Epidermidibacterium keratini TaxID=1891644 RepID=A0A7L4YKR2_9ACTN|nr:hypothetical protein [Epidermidibacterium keratini]QHB99408.1 hypothetical protein EK0264_03335 [Epidermidibacterium keratini]
MSSQNSGGRAVSAIIPAIIGLLLAGAAAFGIINAAAGAQGNPNQDANQQVRQYGEN